MFFYAHPAGSIEAGGGESSRNNVQLATAWPTRWIVRRQGTAAGAFASQERVDDCRSTTNTGLDGNCPEGTVPLTRTALDTSIPIADLYLSVGHSKDRSRTNEKAAPATCALIGRKTQGHNIFQVRE
jgi:hypothetical protein